MKPYYDSINGVLYHGDVRSVLKELPDKSVHCCVTSPPYFGLRDYGVDGQLGLEKTPEKFVNSLVNVFREVKRVLRDDGTLWLNLGDSYAGSGRGNNPNGKQGTNKGTTFDCDNPGYVPDGLKQKDLIGIPWRVAFALQADGWYLRQDIIWHKTNPMPESVRDRCTKAHEYIFLLSKSAKYYYDNEAIKETAKYAGDNRGARKDNRRGTKCNSVSGKTGQYRNKRSVWTVSTKPFKGAHFAVFPPDLIEPCILAGTSGKGCCPDCGTPWKRVTDKRYRVLEWEPSCPCNKNPIPCIVLDPFMGSGTTAIVSRKYGRKFIGIDLNKKYLDEITIPRIKKSTDQIKLF